jgi:hypothetical protein
VKGQAKVVETVGILVLVAILTVVGIFSGIRISEAQMREAAFSSAQFVASDLSGIITSLGAVREAKVSYPIYGNARYDVNINERVITIEPKHIAYVEKTIGKGYLGVEVGNHSIPDLENRLIILKYFNSTTRKSKYEFQR